MRCGVLLMPSYPNMEPSASSGAHYSEVRGKCRAGFYSLSTSVSTDTSRKNECRREHLTITSRPFYVPSAKRRRTSSLLLLSTKERSCMFENHHKYHCPHCRIPILGKSLQQLCNNLNDHNNEKHQYDPMQWSPVGLSCSLHYTPPEDDDVMPLPGLAPPDSNLGAVQGPRQEYLKPYGTCPNSRAVDPEFPVITADDIEFLGLYKVKWL